MAPLSVLPVFLDLRDRRAVVAGGSDAAAWKAELLAAAGAEVHVFAPSASLDPAFERLFPAGAPSRLVHHDRCWDAGTLAGAAMAVADAGSDREASAFFDAARRAGVPVNVIDRPAFCTFQFGAIVNRSPVVVGVSTGGAAPVLGQAIRRRVETLLPRALGSWAALARKLRPTVNHRLRPGAQRRAFWEQFAERAFGPAADEPDETRALDEAERIAGSPTAAEGRVTLVGAGPGAAELLTLKAVRALQSADVILFDDLVSDEVLELARREARRMLVGKRGGRPSCRQEDIDGMTISLARAGRHVVRLKSGDPMIFGRGGEEIARLEEAGIPVDVVPGVTAALAMASALGVSLTHRDHARSVRFVTGHSRAGALPDDLDWKALADPAATTIFYMGGRTARDIAGKLLAGGLTADTPAAIASALARPSQRIGFCTLGTLAAGMAQFDLDDPVIIGIGHVFRGKWRDQAREGPASADARMKPAAR